MSDESAPADTEDTGSTEAVEQDLRSESAERTVEFVVAAIVDQPEMVKVSTDASHATPRINVEVGPGDMGRVIGKRGRVANAIRAVGRAAAAKDGVDIDVEFVD